MEKYKNKYTIPSVRAAWWDYSKSGAYFITINTLRNEKFFGRISSNNYRDSLSNEGYLAEKFWIEIPNKFPFIHLGAFTIMPNHMHGILIIDDDRNQLIDNAQTRLIDNVQTRLIASLQHNIESPDSNQPQIIANPPESHEINPNDKSKSDFDQSAEIYGGNPINDAQTRLIASLQHPPKSIGGITGNHNPMLHQNISRAVRWYKGRSTFEIRKINSSFRWHTRFHDHIIRDESEFNRITKYILANPRNWLKDKT